LDFGKGYWSDAYKVQIEINPGNSASYSWSNLGKD